jgi:hypothetical protein
LLGQFRLNIFYYPIISKHFVRPVSSKHFVRPISSKHFLYNNYLFVQFSCLNRFRPVSSKHFLYNNYFIHSNYYYNFLFIFFNFFLVPPSPPQPMDYNPLRGLQPIPNPHPQPTPNPPPTQPIWSWL